MRRNTDRYKNRCPDSLNQGFFIGRKWERSRQMNPERKYMERALELAEYGRGFTSPNPVVGAVIVKDGEIIGEGWHRKYGQAHAERNAVADCINRGNDPAGAVMYVTLEPCCHHGKQPPCTELIIESGIGCVVTGSGDPNPEVAGKGIRMLRENGIEVVENFMKDECDSINRIFFHYITEDTPYVMIKYAMTADGKTASATGKSKWITCEESRKHAHKLRHIYSAIMVGSGTVLADDPMLDCRLGEDAVTGEEYRNPVRVICDTSLRTPADCRLVMTADRIRTIIATASEDADKIREYTDKGVEVIRIRKDGKSIDLHELMRELRKRDIDSVMAEGGGTLVWSLAEKKLINRVTAYIAPEILGGEKAPTPVRGEGFDSPQNCLKLNNPEISRKGNDILLEWEVES